MSSVLRFLIMLILAIQMVLALLLFCVVWIVTLLVTSNVSLAAKLRTYQQKLNTPSKLVA